MKKIILVVLMAVMLATPCFAQEVEPEGLFSLEGTLWEVCGIIFASIPPFFIGPRCGQWAGTQQYGFYQGKIYSCTYMCTALTSKISSYTDLLVVSFVYDIGLPLGGKWIENPWYIFSAIMQPIGLGVYSVFGFKPRQCGKYGCVPPFFWSEIGIMFKIDDNWTPAGVE